LGVGRWTNNPKLRYPKRGGHGPIWAVEPYDDDDDDIVFSNVCKVELYRYEWQFLPPDTKFNQNSFIGPRYEDNMQTWTKKASLFFDYFVNFMQRTHEARLRAMLLFFFKSVALQL
jgi:hypothetical protein